MSDLFVTGLRVEHFGGEPLGVHTSNPRLSWRTETARHPWAQKGWQVQAFDIEGAPLWDSGQRSGSDSVLVPWGGRPLLSRERVTWRVRVWGADGSSSSWSEPARFSMGLLDGHDWSAVGITAPWDLDAGASAPYLLRRRFTVQGTVARATLHATAHGIYAATLNDRRVGDQELAPGWTAYGRRLYAQTYDVTDLLQPGDNELLVLLADGWWRGRLGVGGRRNTYGEQTAFTAQLEIDLADGRTVVLPTDSSWDAASGPVLTGDLYDGETYDARVVPSDWQSARVVPFDLARLSPQHTPPVRVTQVVPATSLLRSPSGRTIVDFGQNLVGVVRLRVSGPAGTEIILRHAEVLEDGELCTRILRSAAATDRYILRGGGEESWRPTTTTHGFRYVDVEGWPGGLQLGDLEALVMHSDMEPTGTFTCSNPLVNQLHENISWSWRGNTVAVPTDCPQRDERLGWTGDLQVFVETATFLTDTSAFLDGWLRDLAADQLEDGCVTDVVPSLSRSEGRKSVPTAGWGDAATVVPTVLHKWFGDEEILRRQLPSMSAWVDCITGRLSADGVWDTGFQYGDWVDPTVDPSSPAAARTDPGFLATAYFIHSADLVAEAAEILSEAQIAQRYRDVAAAAREAFQHHYVSPAGRVVADTQTGCSVALAFDLVPRDQREIVQQRLLALVRNERHRLATGFLGTPLLPAALTAQGDLADAYELLLNERSPGWLYAVQAGATTVWERWDALQPDGTLNPGVGMLSFNHYAFGAVGQWIHQAVGGLSMLSPGLRHFRAAPQPGIGIEGASISYQSRYGRIAITWSLSGCGCDVQLVVPPNTTADVILPGLDGASRTVASGHHRWRYAVSEEVYRTWVPHRYGPRTTLGALREDPAVWAIVEEVAPPLASLYSDEWASGLLRNLEDTPLAPFLPPLLDRLQALDTLPEEPQPIWPDSA